MATPLVTSMAGNRTVTHLSGTAGGDTLLQSGPGILQSIVVHQALLSGQAISFYDAATAVSGGPLAFPRLGGVPAGPPGGLSGTYFDPNRVIVLNMPFFSGLCISSTSGQAGVTANIIAGRITP